MHLKTPVVDNIPGICHGFFSMRMPTTFGIMSRVISPAPRRWGAGPPPQQQRCLLTEAHPHPPGLPRGGLCGGLSAQPGGWTLLF